MQQSNPMDMHLCSEVEFHLLVFVLTCRASGWTRSWDRTISRKLRIHLARLRVMHLWPYHNGLAIYGPSEELLAVTDSRCFRSSTTMAAPGEVSIDAEWHWRLFSREKLFFTLLCRQSFSLSPSQRVRWFKCLTSFNHSIPDGVVQQWIDMSGSFLLLIQSQSSSSVLVP